MPWATWTATSTSSTTTDQIWYAWNTTYTTTGTVTYQQTYQQPPAPLVTDYRPAQRQQSREEARERAEDLVQLVLGDQMAHDLLVEGSVCFTGSDGRNYEVVGRRDGSYVGNVNILDAEGENILVRLCAHPSEQYYLPGPDMWLGQILAIMHDAEQFCALANIHWDRTGHPEAEQLLMELRALRAAHREAVAARRIINAFAA